MTIRLFLSLATAMLLSSSTALAQETLFEGRWTHQEYDIDGGWRIEQHGEQRTLVLDKSFRTRRGPDLKLFLSPMSIDMVRGGNATKGSVKLAVLKSTKGEQRYAIPADIDFAKYKSIVLLCEKYSKLWGGSKLTKPMATQPPALD